MYICLFQVHHTDDKIKEGTKRDIATKLAQFLVEQLKVPLERSAYALAYI